MAKYRDPKVRVAKPYQGVKRSIRAPKHPFQLRTKPFQIQPHMLAPVLPGETLKNLVHQSRVVTKPIKHPLIGWWTEYFYFYVKLKDIQAHIEGPHMTGFVDEMVTNPADYDPAPLRSAADAKFYHIAGSTNWTKLALETVVEYYFRDQGEDWDSALIDGLPAAQISGKSWLESLTLAADKRTDRDVNLDMNDDGNITVQEAINAQAHWQALRDAGLENLDYEDWIRTFGVQVEEVPESFSRFRPELLGHNRQWAYPTNTVEPTTGVPSSAVSWVSAFREDKDRHFREPGFIIGLNVTKPKVYIKDAKGSLAHHMETLPEWLPALNHAEYELGFLNFAHNAGPLAGKFPTGETTAQGYWVDLRDLLVYGDQFINFAPDSAASALALVDAAGGTRYPSLTEVDGLFSGANKYIEQDGIVNLTIAGRQTDRTPGRGVL